jgi:hypothetical protein
MGSRQVRARLAGTGRPLGDATFDDPWPAGLEALRTRLTILVAGHVAELLHAGRDPLTGTAGPSETCQNILTMEAQPEPNARAYALEVLEREYGDKLTAFRALDAMAVSVIRKAVQIMRANWPEVERLAGRLEQEGEIWI